ncbi:MULTISPECIES: LysR family transcriptional regulator [Pseudomonas]|uniref:LysR family transcriptional regulator n=1 Tax=Pseudomonas TaxID=286 RepID=UPI0013A7295D|nr:LysR family transcriptional regulator [Pseudomonas sp. OIL-1]QIB53281.1 LysR family transcriptional regulator [Pseudomonas sp. OIL-1]
MDYFGALEAFVHSAETRSFTAAGRRLGISSSAVGKAVVRLEEQLDVRLFHRSTRSITLTAEGQLFLNRCQRILAEFEAARAELSQASSAPQGKLRVGLPQIGLYLMPHLCDFQQMFPSIELELNFGDRLVNVIEEGFDAVLRIGEVDDSRLTMRKLKGFTHLLVAAPSYLSRYGTPVRAADLSAHVCLRYRFPSSGKLSSWPLIEQGQPTSVEIPESVIANATGALHAMAEAGVGIALLPEFIIADALSDGRLVKVLEKQMQDERNVRLLWPSGRQSLPKVRAFVDFMVDRLGTPDA